MLTLVNSYHIQQNIIILYWVEEVLGQNKDKMMTVLIS